MEIFPVQYSLLSTAALKDALEGWYGFEHTSCRLIIHNISDTYLLKNQSSKYIFKIYRDSHRNLEEIRGEVELLNILYSRGARVSYPVRDVNGQQIQSFNAAEGIRYGVLFSYAKGHVQYDMNDEQLAVVGHEMAVIHTITANLELTHHRKKFDINKILINSLEKIKPAFKKNEEGYLYLEQTTELVIGEIGKLDLSAFSYGYCHYDLLPGNFHFQKDGRVTFFDFDFAGKGYLVNDLVSFYAHYFLQLVSGRTTHEEASRAFNVFIKSYLKVRPLTAAEIGAIPYFGFAFWMFYLAFEYEHFEDWSNFFFNKNYLKERLNWIRMWVNWYIKSQSPL